MDSNQRKVSSGLAFILSILFHGLLVLFMMIQPKFSKINPEKEKLDIQWVEIKEPKKEEPLENAQIVQQDDKSINDQKPKKDYRLSKNNQDVRKETKAAKNGAFQNRKNKKAGPTKKPQALSQSQKRFKAFESLKPKLFDSEFKQAKLAPKPKPALSGAEVSQSDDYLKDVVAGAETLLRTREFVYYSYYNRIKRKLRQHWEPRIKKKIVKILRQGRRIASVNDKITRLIITLDQGGELVRIQVRSASGYNDLDDAAIEAFRAAAPFPNPPSGIVNGKREVEINWDFVLET